MDACEPGLGGAQSWARNKYLETQALVYEGPNPGCPSLDALGTDRGGSSVQGQAHLPCLPGSGGCSFQPASST